MGKPMQLTSIRGELHKLCTGPLHREGKWIPISGFYIRSNGKPRPNCIDCEGIYSQTERMVPFKRMKFAIDELQARLGKAEVSRRLGITQQTVWQWNNNKRRYLHRRTARKIIILLHQVRAADEVRHPKSIKHGASARGHQERKVKRAYVSRNLENNSKAQLKRWSQDDSS